MSDTEDKALRDLIEKGYVPDRDRGVQGGYVPETSEAGSPPSGGSGVRDDKDKKDD